MINSNVGISVSKVNGGTISDEETNFIVKTYYDRVMKAYAGASKDWPSVHIIGAVFVLNGYSFRVYRESESITPFSTVN